MFLVGNDCDCSYFGCYQVLHLLLDLQYCFQSEYFHWGLAMYSDFQSVYIRLGDHGLNSHVDVMFG